jgi:hypothetical protein
VIDVNFGRELGELRRVNDARGDEVVAVLFEVRRRGKLKVVRLRAEGRRPDDLARLPVDDARAEYAGDDDDGALALLRARALEDALEVRRVPRAAARKK